MAFSHRRLVVRTVGRNNQRALRRMRCAARLSSCRTAAANGYRVVFLRTVICAIVVGYCALRATASTSPEKSTSTSSRALQRFGFNTRRVAPSGAATISTVFPVAARPRRIGSFVTAFRAPGRQGAITKGHCAERSAPRDFKFMPNDRRARVPGDRFSHRGRRYAATRQTYVAGCGELGRHRQDRRAQ